MEVQVISGTVQKFDGVSYYFCGNYYQRKGRRLHRVVWEYHNGEIPEGYHVHHIDGDRSHNDIGNLELLSEFEHLSYHSRMHADESRERIEIARSYACEWHGSKEGAEWHSKHAKEYWAQAPMQTYPCSYCGKEYQTLAVRRKGNHFCCNNCKAAYRRRRIRNGEIEK